MFQRYLKLFVFAMIPASILGPAIMAPRLGSIHLLPHWALLIVCAPVLATLLLQERLLLKLPVRIRVKPYLWFLVSWVAYSYLSIMWTEDQMYGLKMFLLFALTIALVLLVATTVTSLRDLKLALGFYIGILLVNYLVAYVELSYNFHLRPASMRLEWAGSPLDKFNVERARDIELSVVLRGMTGKDIVFGTFGNTNSLGTYLGLTIPLVFSQFFLGRKRTVTRAFALLFCIIGFGLSVYIFSRAYFVVMALIMLIYLFMSKGWYKFLVLGVLSIAVWYVAVFVFPFFDLVRDMSLSQRMGYISTGWQRYLDSFLLLGTGAGSFSDYCIHNLYAEILFKYGVPVLAGYVIFYSFILKNLYAISKRATDERMRYMAQGLFVALCGYTIGCLSDSTRLLDFDSWLLIGLSLALMNVDRRGEHDRRVQEWRRLSK